METFCEFSKGARKLGEIVFSQMETFCKFSEAARKVGEIAWGGSCFVMERWKWEKSLSCNLAFLPKDVSLLTINTNMNQIWNMKYGKVKAQLFPLRQWIQIWKIWNKFEVEEWNMKYENGKTGEKFVFYFCPKYKTNMK